MRAFRVELDCQTLAERRALPSGMVRCTRSRRVFALDGIGMREDGSSSTRARAYPIVWKKFKLAGKNVFRRAPRERKQMVCALWQRIFSFTRAARCSWHICVIGKSWKRCVV